MLKSIFCAWMREHGGERLKLFVVLTIVCNGQAVQKSLFLFWFTLVVAASQHCTAQPKEGSFSRTLLAFYRPLALECKEREGREMLRADLKIRHEADANSAIARPSLRLQRRLYVKVSGAAGHRL